MSLKLDKEVVDVINDEKTVKVLATTNKEGNVHVVFKGSLNVGDDGNIIYLEFIESSITNSNMVHSIWFNGEVTIAVKGEKGESYEIKGVPERALISGPVFEKYYKQAAQKDPTLDLSTVWIIEPKSIRNQSFKKRKQEEEEKHPILAHVDRFAK